MRDEASAKSGMGLLLAAALLGALLGSGVGWATNGSVNFHLVLSCVVLAMLFVLHRIQRRNNRVIQAKLDKLMALKKQASE
jgi:hypothetical protein